MKITKAEVIAKYGASAVCSYPHGDWKWKDQDWKMHEVKVDLKYYYLLYLPRRS